MSYNKGENNPRSKLTFDQVLKIRRDKDRGISFRKLSMQYDVSVKCIQNVCDKSNWADVVEC